MYIYIDAYTYQCMYVLRHVLRCMCIRVYVQGEDSDSTLYILMHVKGGFTILTLWIR